MSGLTESVIPGGVGDSQDVVDTVINNNLTSNQLLSGNAIWLTGLQFAVSSCVIVVDGIIYTTAAENVTLATADGTHPRIDVIVAETDGTAGVVTGTAAATPAKPEIDPNTQVEVTFVLVEAAATTPADVSNEDVYLEDTEWTTADSGATIDPADTTDPYAGTVDILFDTAVDTNFLTLTDTVSHSPTEYNTLFFYIKNIAYGTANRNRVMIALYNSTTRVSDWINLRHNTYDFDGTDTSDYQLVQIPMGNFNLNGSYFNVVRFRIECAGSNSLSFYLDNIKFQQGVAVVDLTDFARLSVTNVFTAAQGSSITTLTDAASIEWNAGLGNVFQVTLDGNRTMAAPTNVVPGFTYILFVIQDDTTGSRTITWNAVFKWAGATAPTLSTGVDDVDVITFIADASGNLHGSLGIADSS